MRLIFAQNLITN